MPPYLRSLAISCRRLLRKTAVIGFHETGMAVAVDLENPMDPAAAACRAIVIAIAEIKSSISALGLIGDVIAVACGLVDGRVFHK